jgi:hypothetical protein
MMKTKNGSQTTQSKFRPVLYPALSFGLILAWVCLKFQVDRVLGGSRETVFYPLLVIASFPDTWVIAAILGGMMVYAHARATRYIPDEGRYTAAGFTSISVQIILLLVGTVFFSSSMLHRQSLSTNEHMYHLMKGHMSTIGGFAADIVMECDSLGLICHSKRAYIQQVCFATDTSLALDPETQSLLFHANQEVYAVDGSPDEEFSHHICADMIKQGLNR